MLCFEGRRVEKRRKETVRKMRRRRMNDGDWRGSYVIKKQLIRRFGIKNVPFQMIIMEHRGFLCSLKKLSNLNDHVKLVYEVLVHKSAERLVRESLCHSRALLLSLELCSVLLLDRLPSVILKCWTNRSVLVTKHSKIM